MFNLNAIFVKLKLDETNLLKNMGLKLNLVLLIS